MTTNGPRWPCCELTAAYSCGCGCTAYYDLDAKDGDATITVADDDNTAGIRLVTTQEDLNERDDDRCREKRARLLVTAFFQRDEVHVGHHPILGHGGERVSTT